MVSPGTALFEYPVTKGEEPNALQVNSVPVTWEVRLILVNVLSQIESVRSVFARSGVGNTVTTISMESPAHPLAKGRRR